MFIGDQMVCTRSVEVTKADLKLAGDVLAEPWCFGFARLGNELVSTKGIVPPLTCAAADQHTPDKAASDPDSPPEAPRVFPVMILDEMTLDELCRDATGSG